MLSAESTPSLFRIEYVYQLCFFWHSYQLATCAKVHTQPSHSFCFCPAACPAAPSRAVANGAWPVACLSTEPGSICTASCSTGYTGTGTATCSKGSWGPVNGTCTYGKHVLPNPDRNQPMTSAGVCSSCNLSLLLVHAVCPLAPPNYVLKDNMNWQGGPGTTGGHTSPREAQKLCNSNPTCLAWNSYGYYLLGSTSSTLGFFPYGGLCVYVKYPGKPMHAGILPLNTMTAKLRRQSGSKQNARLQCCKSCAFDPEFKGQEAEPPEHRCLVVASTRPKGRSFGWV